MILLRHDKQSGHRGPRRRIGMRHHRGVSLVELLVALAVGGIVVLGLAEILASTKATYSREEAFARLQENGRIAAMMLAKDMRPSRSTDCKSIAMHQAQGTLTVKACDLLEGGCTLGNTHYLDIDRALGYDQTQGLTSAGAFSDLPTDIAGNIADRYVGGDVLVTWGIEPEGYAVDGGLGTEGTDAIQLVDALNTSEASDHDEELALISNCQYAHVFEVDGINGSSVGHAGDANAVSHLRAEDLYGGPAPYNREAGDPRAMLYPLVFRVYYVCCVRNGALQTGSGRDNCRVTADGDPAPDGYRPALCVYDRQDGDGDTEVLVPNVADIRITYSGDTDGDGETDFRNEDAATVSTDAKWASVRAASVELLLTTEADNTATATNAPTQTDWPPSTDADDRLGAAYPADNRLYQRFRFDVALRPATPWAIWE